MTRLGLILCCGAILAATPSQAQKIDGTPALPATLAAVMEGKTVPAVGVLVIRNGQVVDQAVAGIDALGSESPATVDDLWNLGSDSKAMTVTMIARLVERGLLSWEAPLSAMLPDLVPRLKPKMRSAAGFHVRMTPATVVPTMAPSELCTIAASSARPRSARLP